MDTAYSLVMVIVAGFSFYIGLKIGNEAVRREGEEPKFVVPEKHRPKKAVISRAKPAAIKQKQKEEELDLPDFAKGGRIGE